MTGLEERKKMVLAMEFIARQTNDESIFERWLMCGVGDGDIDYGCLDTDAIDDDDYYLDDENFAELMGCFLRVMAANAKGGPGGLWCDHILSK